jgi:pimeloyl-ACP methyl ester carboxylesterase
VNRAAWADGADLAYMRRLVDQWRSRFDWRAAERVLNRHPQYLVGVDGRSVHASVTRRPGQRPPLLLLAGWPPTYFEHYKIVPLLEEFEVVCASLPGFGFSDPPTDEGMDVGAMSDVIVAAMQTLGYERFAIHATDLGARVATAMAQRHPDVVVALHFAAVPGVVAGDDDYIRRSAPFNDELGYKLLQATRPQTLSYGLTDSPAAQAAWIVEKLRAWTDCGGNIESVCCRSTRSSRQCRSTGSPQRAPRRPPCTTKTVSGRSFSAPASGSRRQPASRSFPTRPSDHDPPPSTGIPSDTGVTCPEAAITPHSNCQGSSPMRSSAVSRPSATSLVGAEDSDSDGGGIVDGEAAGVLGDGEASSRHLAVAGVTS